MNLDNLSSALPAKKGKWGDKLMFLGSKVGADILVETNELCVEVQNIMVWFVDPLL